MACELFGYDETEMIGLLLKDLVKLKPKDQATILESHLELTGEVVDTAGKVVSNRVFCSCCCCRCNLPSRMTSNN